MRLHHVHLIGGEPGVGQGLPDDALLRGAVGGGEPVARTVLVDRGTAEHGEDRAAVLARVGEPLQEQDAHAFGGAEAVGARRERLAPAVGGQSALLAELHEEPGSGHDVDAARDGQ
ncbi:hypothetical protein EES37_20700 [Streptomyces sp. ADI91-18]|nr:hypothetical protein EES37_20700 [Streptomyces sp. ADI91-18]